MSIGRKIKGLFAASEAAGDATAIDPSSQVIIVDGLGMVDSKKGDATLSPRDQIDILQSLSRINKREKFAIQAVFVGEPLRKVAHGESFDEVQVFFADDATAATALVLSQVKKSMRGQSVVLVTANGDLERHAVFPWGKDLRPATFKKGFDESSSSRGRSGGGNRSSGNRSKSRSGGGNRERSGDGEGGGNRRSGNRSRPPRQPRSEAVGGSDVSDLIDLVE